jgi:futalosine hydrolase
MISFDHFVDECLPSFHPPKLTGTHEMGFPICEGNKVEFDTDFGKQLPVFTANTVSMLSATDELASLYQSKTGASVESMEGAAFGLVCDYLNIKAIQIRGISNYCGERKNQEWDIKKAIQAIQNVLDLI